MEAGATLFAALIGGLFSLGGAYFSIRWQYKHQDKQKEDTIRSFCLDHMAYMIELARDVETMYQRQGAVWYEHIDRIDNAMSVLNRNFEHLIYISSDDLRNRIRRFFSDLYFMSQRARFAQDEIYRLQRELEASGKTESLHLQQITNKLSEVRAQAKEFVLEIKSAALRGEELRNELQKLQKRT